MNKRIFSKPFLSGLLGATLMFSACTDLKNAETDSVIVGSGGASENLDPAALLDAIYKSDIGSITDQAGIYSLYEHTTDEMIPPTRGTDWGDNGVWRQLYQHTWDPTHAYVLGAWNQLNQRVYKCNQILAAKPSPEQAAQAKFLRAFFMWHVMDLFGQVPFRNYGEGVDVNPQVFTRSQALEFVVKDLTEALPNLASKGPDPQNFVPTKAAANAMLARVFLNKAVYLSEVPEGPYTFAKADMDKVVEYVDAVTDEGYSFEDDYFMNFSKNASKEIIFTSSSGTPENRYRMTLHYDNKPDGWNGFATLADFYGKFDANDERRGRYPTPDGTEFSGIARGFLVGQQYNDKNEQVINSRSKKPLAFTPEVPLVGASTEQGIRVIKYHPSDKGQYILLRYSDIYLMKAEAILRGGSGDKTALELVNDLRASRGASALGSLDEAALLDERGRELYWEGYRRVDLVRFGSFGKTWQDKDNADGYRVLFPIPQQAIDSNPNLTQNSGYAGAK
ncbi:RagB/SusD family nutrient uptake outer membrane protein [Chryseolinea lacunae]|uniref:RagB/SusD family nutrient uptake outer membrane protein n=1 Tax=Chryseolinea lacunae TaxID=2801331 RepID=A0ABS1KWP9_9BACT|nr:RagB/SusD family nutrient uptake outer membrane protein [Chryseolinea lacunae]MBL0743623.1 RagB/SusD family nutrient uptake outer membrane protein [Chryseolinea lacunae]